jgi:DNA-binding response OmpR family regulator
MTTVKPEIKTEKSNNENEERPLILVVDDEPLALDIAEMSLARHGFSPIVARGGEEGWQRILNDKPDLVLLDITMPDIDGFEVFERIRSSDEIQTMPVIFVTARDDLEHKVRGLELGAIDYITKPYNPNELVARVRTTLRLQRLEREAGEKDREAAKRQIVETLLITLAHYINNAVAAIQGYTAITSSDDPEAVDRMKSVVDRQSHVVSETIKAIEEMLQELKLDTADYAFGGSQILDIETKIKSRIEALTNSNM